MGDRQGAHCPHPPGADFPEDLGLGLLARREQGSPPERGNLLVPTARAGPYTAPSLGLWRMDAGTVVS